MRQHLDGLSEVRRNENDVRRRKAELRGADGKVHQATADGSERRLPQVREGRNAPVGLRRCLPHRKIGAIEQLAHAIDRERADRHEGCRPEEQAPRGDQVRQVQHGAPGKAFDYHEDDVPSLRDALLRMLLLLRREHRRQQGREQARVQAQGPVLGAFTIAADAHMHLSQLGDEGRLAGVGAPITPNALDGRSLHDSGAFHVNVCCRCSSAAPLCDEARRLAAQDELAPKASRLSDIGAGPLVGASAMKRRRPWWRRGDREGATDVSGGVAVQH
mmetsp:Transcript_120362/g.347886  ORF Transcript_120362/g.347886 Transcript_120362/m.347886 type:complete len:274 (-) Transcript_120362:161-982(-)